MEEDASTPGWAKRAACRWVTYVVLWFAAVMVGLVSAYHPVLKIVAALLGCLLAVSLPILFATLFEITYQRRDKHSLPLMCFPFAGAVVALFGTLALLQASSFMIIFLSSANLDAVHSLNALAAGKDRLKLPRVVCIKRAFVKTEWEAGKLSCQTSISGSIQCAPSFVAAPMFDDKVLSDAGLTEQIQAWAVSLGAHVDTNYRRDGSLCGYLVGPTDLDYHISDYRLAVTRVIEKNKLRLGQFAASGEIVASSESRPSGGLRFIDGGPQTGSAPPMLPLEALPLMLTADPLEVTHIEQAFLAVSLVFLCCCPCVGPVPVALILAFACWSRRDPNGHQAVATDDYDDEDPGGEMDAGHFHGRSAQPGSYKPAARLGSY